MKRVNVYQGIAFAVLITVQLGYSAPSLTIYNQNFAVVRDRIALDLKRGINEISITDLTAHVEPDSVILRDPEGKRNLQILEQNYWADPISEGLLLSLYEGKRISFLLGTNVISGKIIRSGYVPHQSGMQRYGMEYARGQMAASARAGGGQPIIEVDGQLRFSLPGTPLYPSLPDETILKPTLHWQVEADREGKLDAELAYLTGGMSWDADYNMVSLKKDGLLEVTGWVTIDNQSGKSFPNAQIKLMAGNVNKIQSQDYDGAMNAMGMSARSSGGLMDPTITQKTFDEYHLYTLNRAVTLRDRETKQVEFVRAGNVQSERIYVYDGAAIEMNRYRGYSMENIRQDRDYGTKCNPQVWVMREFQNSEKNHLGIPLPKGRVRFYQRDDDGHLEFTGENVIEHTPKDETLRVYTGDAFDIKGTRTRTDFKLDSSRNWCDETFEIRLRNRKEKDVIEVRVVEHLYRWVNWEIIEKSNAFQKIDSQTAEFRLQLNPGEEKVLTYKVHYTW